MRPDHRRSKPAQVFTLNILPRRQRDASGQKPGRTPAVPPDDRTRGARNGRPGRHTARDRNRGAGGDPPGPSPPPCPRSAPTPNRSAPGSTMPSRPPSPEMDGTLGAERAAAQAYQRMAKAKNTRAAYRSAVRAWCDWCAKRDLPPLPRLRPRRGCLAGGRAPAGDDAQHHRSAPGRHPLPAPRRRLPGADRRCLRVGNCRRHPPRCGGQRPIAGEEGRRHGRDHPAVAGADPGRPAGQARPRPAPGRLRRRVAPLGVGGHPVRAAGEDRPWIAADDPTDPRDRRRTPSSSPCPSAGPSCARCAR